MIGELPVSMEIEQCLKLVNEHFPGVIPNNLQNTSLNRDGWGSLVLDIDDAYIFRFPRRPEVLAGYSKEKALLPVIARALPVAIPVFEFIAMDDLDYRRCFIGYRKIHGEPWSLELAKSHPITDQLAHFLSALHQFPVERAAQLKALSVDSAGWRDKYESFYHWVQKNVTPFIEPTLQCRIAQDWENYLGDEKNFHFKPVLIHADLCGDHILCERGLSRLNGIIDWEDATLGDPALDFVGILYLAGWEPVDELLEVYEGNIDPAFRRRIEFYLKVIPYHQISFGLEIDSKTQFQAGINALTEQLGLQVGK